MVPGNATESGWTQPTVTSTARKELRSRKNANKLLFEDRAVHDWYRFVLSYPPHLVRDYLARFGVSGDSLVLDPFCGTGTTVVECKKLGLASVGLEANPVAHLACSVKAQLDVPPDALRKAAEKIAGAATREIEATSGSTVNLPLFVSSSDSTEPVLRTLPETRRKLILKNSISPVPLHKSLVLIDHIKRSRTKFKDHLLLGMAKALVGDIGNLHFGPEVGVRGSKEDAPVVESWLHEVRVMAKDLNEWAAKADVPADVRLADARSIGSHLRPNSISAVITSPPYPNEKDYTRTTRLEGVLLGLIQDKEHLRSLKKTLIRSNTRSVYVADDDDQWVEDIPEVARIAKDIEDRRIELGKTSGFERQYHRVTKLYFGGMARHFADLRPALRPGAKLAYVVGDQASYLRVMIRTGQILAQIAEKLGYTVDSIDLFRKRRATATRAELREEVVVLEWPG